MNFLKTKVNFILMAVELEYHIAIAGKYNS